MQSSARKSIFPSTQSTRTACYRVMSVVRWHSKVCLHSHTRLRILKHFLSFHFSSNHRIRRCTRSNGRRSEFGIKVGSHLCAVLYVCCTCYNIFSLWLSITFLLTSCPHPGVPIFYMFLPLTNVGTAASWILGTWSWSSHWNMLIKHAISKFVLIVQTSSLDHISYTTVHSFFICFRVQVWPARLLELHFNWFLSRFIIFSHGKV